MAVVHNEIRENIDSLVVNSEIAQLYRHWMDRAPIDGLPNEAVLSHHILTKIWPRLMILRSEGTDYRYQHYGAGIAAHAGFDMTGQSTADFNGEVGNFFKHKYDECVAYQRPIYTVHKAEHAKAIYSWERLMMPVKGTTGTVKIICYNQPLDRKSDLLDTLLHGSFDGIFILRPVFDKLNEICDFVFHSANPHGCELLECNESDLIGNTICNAMPNTGNGFLNYFKHSYENGESCRFELYMKLQATTKVLRYSVARSDERLIVICSNVTRIRESQNRLETIISNINYGILFIDTYECVQLINKQFRDMWGISKAFCDKKPTFSELIREIGTNSTYDIPELEWKEHAKKLRNFLYLNDTKVYEYNRFDGTIFECKCFVLPDNGRMLTYADITHRKKIERMKDEFVSVVSHELRTPVTSLIGSLKLIRGGAVGTLPKDAKSMIALASANAERLSDLVNDILDVQKIGAGHMKFELTPTEIISLTRQTLAENAGYGAEHDVRFCLEENIGAAYVKADEHRLIQVVTNLLSNAAKFSPEGEEVIVRLQRFGERIRLSVTDKGPGIPSDMRDQIFEKFSQVESSLTRAKQGTGLGLNIVKSIIEKHGSQIQVVSKVGEGSTFYFDLDEVNASTDDDNVAAA